MGAGNKLDPTLLRTADISEPSVDPLARVMRKELRRRGIDHLKVVFSTEPALQADAAALEACREEDVPTPSRRSLPGSVAFVPSVMGLIMAGEVVKDIALNRLNRPLRAEQAKEEA
jgi:tRNA A37 threonylcarbamoyladenosine dehydratase